MGSPSPAPSLFGLCRFLAIPLVLCAASAGCAKKGPPASASAPVAVRVVPAVSKTMPVQVRTFGAVEAYSTIAVRAQIGGELTQVHFAEGQMVHKGDLLFSIDPRLQGAALHLAEATLARDKATMANAEVEAKRADALYRQGAYTQEQYDNFRAAADATAATVDADQALVQNAQVLLSYCKITSPIEGRTGSVLADQGNVIKANDVPMVNINQVRPIYATFSVPEQNLPSIRRQMTKGALAVQAFIPEDSQPAQGTLTFVDNQVDRTTGTILLKGTFSNEDERLWPGQYVRVVLTLEEQPGVVVVPVDAVQTGQKGTFVFIVKPDMKADVQAVTTGDTVGDETVIRAGLKGGETVVTDGQLRLTAGTAVEVIKEPSTQGTR